MIEYCPCSKCGIIVDDGCMREGVYLCHECLDAEDG